VPTFPFARAFTVSVDVLMYHYGKGSDRWRCDTHLISNPFRGFVMESYYSALEMADVHLMYGAANGKSREVCRLYA
jgi:hypothetical protein